MRRVTPSWFASSCVLCLPFVATNAPLPAQGERVQRLVASALANFEDPALVADSVRRLEHLGAAAVPLLRARLQWPGRRQLPPVQVQHIAHVLGRLGPLALPALEELRLVLRTDETEVALQAAWALGQLAPFLPTPLRDTLRTDLGGTSKELRDSAQGRILYVQLSIPDDEPLPSLLAMIDAGGEVERMAACRWIVAARRPALREHPELLRVVDQQLASVMARPPIAWTGPGPGAYAIAELTEAWLALSQRPLDPRSARGLLASWDPELRHRGLVWLREAGASLPPRDRIDVVARLWDIDGELVRSACATLAAWGEAGLVGLAPLRAMERNHPDATTARHAGEAAEAILAATSAWPAEDRAWLLAFDAALRGSEATVPATPMGTAGRLRLAETLPAARWQAAEPLAAALQVLEEAGPCPPEAVQAVFGWLRHDDADVVGVACAWLARRGSLVRRAVADEFQEPFDTVCRRLVVQQMHPRAVPVGLELAAHLLTAGLGSEDRAALLEDGTLRFVARALADGLLTDPASLQRAAARLQFLVGASLPDGVVVQLAPWGGMRTLAGDLSGPVRALAALALVALGQRFEAPADLDAVLTTELGVPLADLPAHVKALREANEFEDLVTRLEDRCRERLGVDANLRWRPAAARR